LPPSVSPYFPGFFAPDPQKTPKTRGLLRFSSLVRRTRDPRRRELETQFPGWHIQVTYKSPSAGIYLPARDIESLATGRAEFVHPGAHFFSILFERVIVRAKRESGGMNAAKGKTNVDQFSDSE
jgi:hypothetical protein